MFKNNIFKNSFKNWTHTFQNCEVLSNLIARFNKKNNFDLIRCIICYEFSPSKNVIQCKEGHEICQKCLQQLAKTHIYSVFYNTIIKGFPCPHYSCEDHLSYEICTKFLSKKLKLQIQSKIYEAMLMNAEIKFDKNDELSEALIHKCYNCSLPFIKKDGKNEGCNEMDCPCGASQCYACRAPTYPGIAHHCLRQKEKAHEIHERDVEMAKLKYFLKSLI
uniref:RING-type domain-containing protein n=1 Tax=Panagrolaimus superbus TaxID=310955 RepID=A0A914YFX7_9BILA